MLQGFFIPAARALALLAPQPGHRLAQIRGRAVAAEPRRAGRVRDRHVRAVGRRSRARDLPRLAGRPGPQWLLAEDLGDIDEAVHDLRHRSGLLCTRVLQFGFGGDAENLHLPCNVPDDAVVYTGTHDNDTSAGWWHTATAAERGHLVEVLGLQKGDDVVRGLVDAALSCDAHLAILPAQTIVGTLYGPPWNAWGTPDIQTSQTQFYEKMTS